eukprot:2880266-Amphidinium_carterae.1
MDKASNKQLQFAILLDVREESARQLFCVTRLQNHHVVPERRGKNKKFRTPRNTQRNRTQRNLIKIGHPKRSNNACNLKKMRQRPFLNNIPLHSAYTCKSAHGFVKLDRSQEQRATCVAVLW